MLPPTQPITVHQVSPHVWWASGGVGNTGIIVGPNSVTLVDTTISPDAARELVAKVREITPKPIGAVVLTHGDIDHVSGLSAMPAGVKIYAQANTAKRMAAGVAAGRSRVPADRLPNQPVDTHAVITDGAMRIDLFHWAPAHTDGDIVVWIPGEKVVFTGDIFAMDQPRALIHAEQDGTSLGWITSARHIVALPARTFAVGHGEAQTRAVLAQRVALVTRERAEVARLAAAGRTLAEVQQTVGDPPPGSKAPAANGPRFAPFSSVVYDEVTKGRK